jgi:hypothetical protein
LVERYLGGRRTIKTRIAYGEEFGSFSRPYGPLVSSIIWLEQPVAASPRCALLTFAKCAPSYLPWK